MIPLQAQVLVEMALVQLEVMEAEEQPVVAEQLAVWLAQEALIITAAQEAPELLLTKMVLTEPGYLLLD